MTEALAASHASRLARRYTLLEKIGVGGQGEVWRARDEATGSDIALKLLSPALAANDAAWAVFVREHTAAARLDHAGILRIHPPQREGEFAVLPMSLATGGDARRLRGASYLDIVPVLMEVAEALEHAHERGVIHRDLKPGNILFDDKGRALVADFGVAHIPEAAVRESARPALSPFSASPQQLRGEPAVVTDDVYGLGALAYELLSGYPPYYPRFEMRRVLEEPVPAMKLAKPLPPQLEKLVMRMLAKNSQQRPQSMRSIIDALDATLNDTLTFEFDEVSASARRGARPQARSSTASPPHREPVAPASAPAPAYTAPMRAAPPPPAPPPPVPPPAQRPAAAPWDDLKFEVKPRLMRLEQEPARRGPWLVLALLAGLAFGAFYWLPRYAPEAWLVALSGVKPDGAAPSPAAATDAPPQTPRAEEPAAAKAAEPDSASLLAEARETFRQRLDSLETRGAGVWGGPDFASAKARAAESVGAYDAGNPKLAVERLQEASRLLRRVEARVPGALAAQLDAAERAFAAGQPEVARQAYEAAFRIDPQSVRAAEGLRRVGSLGGVLPLLADGQNAEAARDYARAVQDYSQALSLDPGNETARAGLKRAHAAFGEDSYAKAVGSGFAALGAGRLEEARASFEEARSIRPGAVEAANGLSRVGAALSARGFAFTRQRGAALEAEERWSEALKEYEAALQLDPSLSFAQDGKARTAARAQLATGLQSLIDEPERLAAPSVRAEAEALIDRARAISDTGPVLRSQVARLEILLPEFDKPVRLALVSDNATQVAIQRVGEFGSFQRREIELKPGKYTVVGKREGFRDVRHDVTIAPGSDQQTISVSCVERI
jgi:tetratricopeptide (TPR) repeat protein